MMTFPKLHRYEPEAAPPRTFSINSAPGRIDERRPRPSDLDPIEEATKALDRADASLRALAQFADEDLAALPFPMADSDDSPFAA